MDDLISQGIAAAQSGNKQLAEQLLSKAVKNDPTSSDAWHWLGTVLDDPDKQAYCFQRSQNVIPDVSPFIITHPDEPAVLQPPFDESKPSSPSKPENTPVQSKFFLNIIIGIAVVLSMLCLGAVIFTVLSQPHSQLPAPTTTPTQTYTRVAVIATTGPANTPVIISAPTFTPTFLAPARADLPTKNADQIRETLQTKFKEGLAAMDVKMYPRSLEIWSGILSELPDYSDAYYERGKTYRLMNTGENQVDTYLSNLNLAVQNLDHAIELDPTNGNYFFERSLIYTDLAKLKEDRIESDRLYAIALENSQMAVALGNTQENYQQNVDALLNRVGQCQAALSGAQSLAAARLHAGQDQSADLNAILAVNYNCLQQFGQAIIYQNAVVDRNPACSSNNYLLAVYLYNASETQASLKALSDCIIKSPIFNGERYFLRALIYYQQDKFDLAARELDTGIQNTWMRGGLNAYVRGKLAQKAGDKVNALELLQSAEATWPREMDWMRPDIQKEIKALGGNLSTPGSPFASIVTPIPPLASDFKTPTLTP